MSATPNGSDTPPRHVLITLVHGTFAAGAAWTLDDSPLCRALRERIPGVSISPFTWSGRNSNRARLDAGWELARWTETRISEYERVHGGPVDHYVIAHSHGGNVVLYACRSRHFAEHLTKLVCLSTPFLSARVRDHARGILLTLELGLIFWAAAIAVFLGVRLWMAAITATAVFIGWAALTRNRLDRLENRAGRIADELSPPTPGADSVLILRGDRDEATGALVSAHFPTAIASLLWGWFDKVRDKVHSASNQIGRHRAQSPNSPLADLALAVVASYAYLLLMMVMAVVAVALIPLFALSTLSFGRGSEMLGQSLFVEIVADSTPPGSWTLHRLRDYPFHDPRLDGVLRHSLSYGHENAIKAIVGWLVSGAVPGESSFDVRLWHRQ